MCVLSANKYTRAPDVKICLDCHAQVSILSEEICSMTLIFAYVALLPGLSIGALTHWCREKMAATLADDIFKCNFHHENVWFSTKISLKLVPRIWINNTPALVQLMIRHQFTVAYMRHSASLSLPLSYRLWINLDKLDIMAADALAWRWTLKPERTFYGYSMPCSTQETEAYGKAQAIESNKLTLFWIMIFLSPDRVKHVNRRYLSIEERYYTCTFICFIQSSVRK